MARDLKFRYLGRKACKMGLIKWYKFGIGSKNQLQLDELTYWKDDITDYLKTKLK